MERLPFVLAAIAIASSCIPAPEPEVFGRRVSIGFESEPQALCAGTVEYLDLIVEQAFAFLGEPVPVDFRVPIRVVSDLPCDLHAAACFHVGKRAVYVTTLEPDIRNPFFGAVRHELMHAVVYETLGRSVPFLEEGLAEALGRGIFESPFVVSENPDVGPQIVADALDLDYEVVARFTRYLIDEFGLDLFKRLFRQARVQSDAWVRNSFARILGVEFDRINEKFQSGEPRCTYQLDRCRPDDAELVAFGWSEEFTGSCADPDFVGTWDSVAFRDKTIHLTEGGRFLLRSTSELVFSRCGECPVQFLQEFDESEMSKGVVVDLDSGIYNFHIRQPSDEVSLNKIELIPLVGRKHVSDLRRRDSIAEQGVHELKKAHEQSERLDKSPR